MPSVEVGFESYSTSWPIASPPVWKIMLRIELIFPT